MCVSPIPTKREVLLWLRSDWLEVYASLLLTPPANPLVALIRRSRLDSGSHVAIGGSDEAYLRHFSFYLHRL
jgi:hypothetical protein